MRYVALLPLSALLAVPALASAPAKKPEPAKAHTAPPAPAPKPSPMPAAAPVRKPAPFKKTTYRKAPARVHTAALTVAEPAPLPVATPPPPPPQPATAVIHLVTHNGASSSEPHGTKHAPTAPPAAVVPEPESPRQPDPPPVKPRPDKRFVTNEGLVALARAGYDEEFLRVLVRSRPVKLDLSVEGLAYLARQGLSQDFVMDLLSVADGAPQPSAAGVRGLGGRWYLIPDPPR